MTYLLDSSLLIPLLLEGHEHHEAASSFVTGKKLALCPITELAFLRVSTGAYNAEQSAARKALADFHESDKPQFVPDDLPLLDTKPFPSSKTSTDWYLCELATKNGMKLAAFDKGIKHPSVELVG